MDLKALLKKTFKQNIFSRLKEKDILKERVRLEKHIELISDDLKEIQEKIRTLMLESKGQPNTMKMLNIQKIKALRLESVAKQEEATTLLKQQQLMLLVEAMKEHEKSEQKSEMIDKILNSDIEHLNKVLFDTDVQRAMEEGKMDTVKNKLKRVFAKEDMPVDEESHQILKAIDDLEKVDEETAMRMAGEKAKEMSEMPLKKKRYLEEE